MVSFFRRRHHVAQVATRRRSCDRRRDAVKTAAHGREKRRKAPEPWGPDASWPTGNREATAWRSSCRGAAWPDRGSPRDGPRGGRDCPRGGRADRPGARGGHVARRPILLELLLVLAHGLVIAVTVLPVGAEILPVLSDIPIVLPHVLAVLAQVALVTPELTAVLLHLRVGRQGRRLPVHARRPGGHCERSEHCHYLPSAHVFLRDWDAVHLVRRGAADGRLPGGRASDEPQECAS